MAIKKIITKDGVFYNHILDEIEYANPYEFLVSQSVQMYITRHLYSIEKHLGPVHNGYTSVCQDCFTQK